MGRSLDTYLCGETSERRVVLAADEALGFGQDCEQVVPSYRDLTRGNDRCKLAREPCDLFRVRAEVLPGPLSDPAAVLPGIPDLGGGLIGRLRVGLRERKQGVNGG